MNYSSAKKKALLFTALVLVLSTFGTSFASDSFSDLQDSSWAAPTIEKWSGYGLINGFSDGTFKPKNAITRAEFAVIAYNAFDLQSDLGKSFYDVSKKDWYYEEVSKIAKLGYMNGKAAGIFDPKAYITRSEAAVILANIQGLKANETGAQVFVDYEAIPSWARGLVGASAHANYISGYNDGSFKGSNTITRAEAVAMLDNTVYGANAFADNWKVVDAGTYGGTVEKPVTVKGNVYVKTAGVELKNIIVEGNLVLGIEIGEGEATLNNVVVKGDTNVVGGGKNSIKINGGSYGKIFVLKNSNSPVRLLVTNVKGLDVVIPEIAENVNLLLEGVFNEVRVLAAGSNVTTQGKTTIETMTIEKTAVDVVLQTANGTVIATVVIDVKVTVLGQGRIIVADVNVSDVTFEKKPETVNDVPTTPAPTPTPTPTPVVTRDYAFKMVKGNTAVIGHKVYSKTEALSLTLLSEIFEMAKIQAPEWKTDYSNFISEMLLEETTGGKPVALSLALRVKAYVTNNTSPALAVFNDAGMSAIVDAIISKGKATDAELTALITAITSATLDEFVTDIERLYPATSDEIPPSFGVKILNGSTVSQIKVNELRSTLLSAYSGKTIESVLNQPLLTLVRTSDNTTVQFIIGEYLPN